MRDYDAILQTAPDLAPVRKFIVKGGRLKKSGGIAFSSAWEELIEELPSAAEFEAIDRRVVQAVLAESLPRYLTDWVGVSRDEPTRGLEELRLLGELARAEGLREEFAGVLGWIPATLCDPSMGAELNGLGRYLLEIAPFEFNELFPAIGPDPRRALLNWLIEHDRGKIRDRLPGLLTPWDFLEFDADDNPGRLLLELDDPALEKATVTAFEAEANPASRCAIGAALLTWNRERYLETVIQSASVDLPTLPLSNEMIEGLVEAWGEDAIPPMLELVRSWKQTDPPEGYYEQRRYQVGREVLEATARRLGPAARPVMDAAMDCADLGLQISGLRGVMLHAEPTPDDHARLLAILGEVHENFDAQTPHQTQFWGGPADRTRQIRGHWAERLIELLPVLEKGGPDLVPEIERLLEHDATAVRSAAVASFVRSVSPASVNAKAEELLGKKKGSIRLSGVRMLIALGTEAALKRIEERLEAESDEKVRDEILVALDPIWQRSNREFTLEDIGERMARCEKALAKPVAPWLDEETIAPFVLRSGREVTPRELRYLCVRQSRSKDMTAEIEARAFYALLDREHCADGALEVLDGFLNSKADAKDKWAVAIAGLLGDDRVVLRLEPAIHGWASKSRGKLAEIVLGALANLPGDRPLRLLDKLSQKYRTKQKNIGAAAGQAFEEAARNRGLTADELGDDVVPWLGFEPGEDRVIDAGSKSLRVSIGPDLKLRYTDTASGKTVKSIPKAASAETKAELKTAAADLRDAVKSQATRHERMMILERRWPVARWIELYRNHPVLQVFGGRSVWGCYNDQGELTHTFRLLEDLTCTSADDDDVSLPSTGTIGLVHALELDPDSRTAWSEHFADHEVIAAFDQIDRGIVLPADDQRDAKSIDLTKGVTLSALTFKGRAERQGWMRGSVVDAGGVTSYLKDYPASRTTALLLIEQLWVGADFDDEAILDRTLFVPAGSVETGGYVYDEPSDERDPRLIALGDVPPIVYSETMTDLRAITGL